MDLIVTHENADFDALSSLVAAGKLYPNARLLLPGSQEKAVRKFLSLIKDIVKIEDEKTCRMDDVTRLVIVDNRHRSRIGSASSILSKKKVKVHIYDHHPRTPFDIKADRDVFREVGATVSILLDILLKKGKLNLTPLEATLMLLGIYEETGFLSYSATTRLDVDMVGRLLEQGANLNAVSLYLNRELSGNELSALVKLLESIEVVEINGINTAFAQADAAHFNGEMGTVVHKLQDVENYPLLFVLFSSGEKVKVMARSRMKNVDVNKLLGHFRGAGHAGAASARIDGRPSNGVKSDIVKLLRKMTQPEVYAKDIMRSPVLTVSQEEKVSEVFDKLKKLGCKGVPVTRGDGTGLAGMITLGDVKKAYKRGMGHSRIKGYMSTPLVTVTPGTPLYIVKKIMMERDKGRIPVVAGGKLLGMVTRTDVLKKVHSSLFYGEPGRLGEMMNIAEKMEAMLPGRFVKMIKRIGREADKLGVNVFLVGGLVRDLLLSRKNYDLDIVVEGDAIQFGKILSEKFGGTLVAHRKFGTATLVKDWPAWLGPSLHADNKFKIDIATARREVYKTPAALPTVRFSSLKEDLYRRDFTVNAMAANINKERFGLFIDFFGGMKDLKKKTIRALHDRSFIDDPTRIFRAVRFEQRFAFTIEKHTEYLIKHAVKREMFQKTENQRIRDELILILKEKKPEKAVSRLDELHELRFIHPDLVLKKSIRKKFDELRKCLRWYGSSAAGKRKLDVWLMYFMLITDGLTEGQVAEILEKFVFTRSVSARLRAYKHSADKIVKKLSSAGKVTPGEIYDILEPLAHEVVLCVMAGTKSAAARRRIRKFFTSYNGTKLMIRGADLKKEGIKPGPQYKEILRQVLCKKLDGRLPSKKDEIRYLRELISE